MPLTYDDREDLYIRIDCLRREADGLHTALNHAERERDYWKEKYNSLLIYVGVIQNGRKM